MGRGPSNLVALPPDYGARGVSPGCAERGRAVLEGRYRLGQRTVALGGSPWEVHGMDEAEQSELHCFDWFGDLAALGDAAAGRHARACLESWDAAFGSYSPVVWQADVLSRRLANWLIHYDALFAGVEPAFRMQVLDSIARQLRHLRRVAASETDGDGRLDALAAMIYAEVCVADDPERLERAMALLETELDAQILSDGGHLSRSPARQLAVLEQLVDIRDLLTAARREIPVFLRNAIDRMAPIVRFFRLGDGGPACFNGGGRVGPSHIDRVLERSDAKGRPPPRAPYTRFERVEMAELVLLLDGGAPAPEGFDRGAHAGTLSFEFSVAGQPVFVNCGGAPEDRPAWCRALRTTAAHNAVTVADTNSAELLDGGIGRRAGDVQCDRGEIDGSVWVSSSHDGYEAAFGLTCRRRLYLDHSGADLRGEDILVGPAGHDFALRFHLHPAVTATLDGDDGDSGGQALTLDLPGLPSWRFRVSAPVTLEDSIYWDAAEGPLPTRQIVAPGRTEGDATTVKWALQRDG